MSQKISNEELLEELKKLKEILGRNPKQQDLKLGKYSCNAYKRAFGGISKALILIGEKPTFYKGLTKQDIIDEVKRIYLETGEIPIYTIFKEKAKCSYQTARAIINYTPWHIFLKECNLFTEEQLDTVKICKISEQELIDEVIRLKEMLGRCPTHADMSVEGKYGTRAYVYKYDSYANAMKELGFDDFQPRHNVYKNCKPTKGNDNIFYKSTFEATVANFLFEYKNNSLIKDYQYEKVVYKKDNWRWTCDFYITFPNGTDLYLECDGMGNHRKDPYTIGNKKIQYYIDNNYAYKILKYTRNVYKNLYNTIFEDNNEKTNI